MNWAAQLKSMVVEDDPQPTPPVKVTMVTAPEQTVVYREDHALSVTPVAFTASPASDGFLAKLNQKIAVPGGAAEKFQNTLASLSAIPDDSMRLMATLSVLKNTAGIDKSALLNEYAVQQRALDQEVANFATAISAQRRQELDERQAQLAGIEMQIHKLNDQRLTLANSVTEARDRLDRSQAGFDNAAEAMRTKIAQAIARLKGGA